METVIAALDLETTGLITKTMPGIVEIGMIKDDGELFSTLIQPEEFFTEEAQKISGITQEEVDSAPSFRAAFFEVAKFLVGVDFLITFNGTNFDIPIILHHLHKNKVQHRFPWPPVHYDLMPITKDIVNAKNKRGIKKNPNLMEVHKYLFDEEFDSRHRALSDAQATLRCALELLEQEVIKTC